MSHFFYKKAKDRTNEKTNDTIHRNLNENSNETVNENSNGNKTKKSKKKMIIFVVSIVIVLAFIADLGVGNYLLNFAVVNTGSAGSSIHSSLNVSKNAKQAALEEKADNVEKEATKQAIEWDETATKQEVSVKSKDDLTLKGTLYAPSSLAKDEKANGNSNGNNNQNNDSIINGNKDDHRWVILLHGYNGSSIDMITYAQNYSEHGFHVLNIDQRSYGKSEGGYTGMGWLEKEDLKQWITFVIKQDKKANIALHGISMGAATIMMASGDKLPRNVKVMIEDCGYTSVWDEFSNKLEALFHLPTFPLLNTASILCDIRMGYGFKRASSVEQLKKNTTPMLFIHGSADDYNPFWMEDVVYRADANTDKEKLVVKGARHAMSSFTEPDIYWEHVFKFMDQYM